MLASMTVDYAQLARQVAEHELKYDEIELLYQGYQEGFHQFLP